MGVTYGQKVPCTMCTSSDAMQIYLEDDGSYNASCFSCSGYDPDPYNLRTKTTENRSNHTSVVQRSGEQKRSMKKVEDIVTLPTHELKDRRLHKETCGAFGVNVSLSPSDGVTPTSHYYPVYKKSKLTGYKERVIDGKKFFSHGDCKNPDLFGQIRGGSGKTVYITEGELDCMSVWQSLRAGSTIKDWDPTVVSIARGAASAKSDCIDNYEFLNSFSKIVIIFDQDEAGRLAAIQVAKIFSGKSYFVTIPENDPSAMLQAGRSTDLYWAIQTNAHKYKPDGIINGADTWERFRQSSSTHSYPYPTDWEELNKRTYGVRGGSIVTVTSGSGSGKTSLLEELKKHFFETTDEKIADIALEQDVGDSVGNQISLHLNKRIMLPDVVSTEEEQRQAHDRIYGSGRWDFYDHFGGMDDDTLFDQLTFFAASGHKFIFLDHLSIIISEFADKGSERERIDSIMTKLAKIVKAYGVVLFLVVHLKKTGSGKSFEEGLDPTLDDLRGSSTIKQLSWDVIAISRNQQHEDPFTANTSKVSVLKCRFTGRTGVADYLHYGSETGRMKKVPMPENFNETKRSNIASVSNRF